MAASIGDFVWNDLNTDGIQDVGEPGVSGVTVQLLNSSNTVLQTTTTNGSGFYSFTGLAAGTYSIKTLAPAGFGFSPADQGSNEALDSDHLTYLGQTAPITLGTNDNFGVDIGLAQKFTVTIPDVTWVSSPTAALTGYVDVKFTNVPGGAFVDKLSAYNAGIILTPTGSASAGVNLIHDAIEATNAIFPGQDPQDYTTSGNLQYVADNLPVATLPAVAENQILNNQGIFRLQFSIPAGATGDYQLSFDPNNTLFFDTLSNQITNLDLVGGTIHLVPTIAVTAVTATANEGSGGAPTRAFDITLSHASTQTITVLVNTVDGTATAGDGDFTPIINQLVTFAPGTLTQTINVTINGDNKVELDESFNLALSSPTNVVIQIASAQTTLINDDSATITVNSLTVNELNSGSTPLNFTVSLSNPVDVPVMVTLNTADGTAVLGTDFTSTSTVLTFAAGSTTPQSYAVGILGDNTVELTETFGVTLGSLSASGRSVTTGAAGTGTITNDDSATVTVNSLTVNELNSGSTPLNFTVSLSNPVDVPVMVTLNTADGTAVLGTDFTSTSTVLAFAAGSTTPQSYAVGILGDNTVELTESFGVTLGSLSASGRNVTTGTAGTGTITNDDSALISVVSAAANSSVFEGNPTATNVLNFTVALSNPVDVATTVTISTVTGTAVAADFTGSTITHTFAAGSTSFNFPVTLTADNIVELDESFSVGLSTLVPNGRNISLDTLATTATGVIQNDDSAIVTVTNAAGNPSITEGQAGDTNVLNFVIALSNPVDEAVTVTISTATGTALASDFFANNITHTFNAGQTSFTFPVTLKGDLLNELDEQFSVTLSSLVTTRSVTLGASATGTIINDDFDVTGPKVLGIYVRSTDWSASYLNRLAANGVGDSLLGYRLDVGAEQLSDLPWINLNQISLVFSEDVIISNDDIKLRGVNVTDYTLSGSYNLTTTSVATWNLASSAVIGRDKLLVQLSANALTGVVDINGNALDGNSLTNNTNYSAFPTGDGVNGGDLTFRFDVLPGNTDRGVAPGTAGVFGGDVTRVRDAQFSLIGNPAYPIFYDVDGSGTIFGGDVNNVRDRQFTNLPVGEPSGSSFITFFAQLAEDENQTEAASTPTALSTPATLPQSANSLQVEPNEAAMYWFALGKNDPAFTTEDLSIAKKRNWIIT